MKMKRGVSIVIFPILLVVFCEPVFADQAKEEAAKAASEAWLGLVDKGKYSESWNQGASYFKNAVSEAQWTKSMVGFRKPLGDILSRRLISKKYTNTLPGAPDGEYVVVQYETSFENNKGVTH